jgi:hypothetical protein
MAVTMNQGSLPHIYWIDLEKNGVYTECAVMKRDPMGNVYFFPVKSLDDIDNRRLYRILTNRNAQAFELWDLMSQITLNNGVNALTYFHQLVKVITPGGKVMRPQEGVVGIESQFGQVDTRGVDSRRRMEEAASVAANAAAQAAGKAAADAIRESQQPRAYQQAPQAQAPAAPAETAPAAKKPAARRTTKKPAAE